jgi:hypothetical protein
MQDFMQTYMMMQNIRQTQEQLRMQAVRDKAGALSILDNVLANVTDPDARNQVVAALETDFGFSPGQLSAFATGRTSTAAAQAAGASERGTAALPMEVAADLESRAAYQVMGGISPFGAAMEERTLSGIDDLEGQGIGVNPIMAMRELFGQTPGQFAVDQQIPELSQPELEEAAGISIGTRADAGNVLGATGQAAAIRASEQGNILDYNARMAQLMAAQQSGEIPRDPSLSAKDLGDDIISMMGQLREGGLGASGEDFIQRSISSRAIALINHPLNPYPDIYPGNPMPGETQEQHLQRAIQEVVQRITGQRMSNKRTIGEVLNPLDNR